MERQFSPTLLRFEIHSIFMNSIVFMFYFPSCYYELTLSHACSKHLERIAKPSLNCQIKTHNINCNSTIPSLRLCLVRVGVLCYYIIHFRNVSHPFLQNISYTDTSMYST